MIKKYDDIEIVKEKDFLKNPKENGYRSYHLVIKSVLIKIVQKSVDNPLNIRIKIYK